MLSMYTAIIPQPMSLQEYDNVFHMWLSLAHAGTRECFFLGELLIKANLCDVSLLTGLVEACVER